MNNIEQIVLKTKEDTAKIFQMMNSCFYNKIQNLSEWMVVACIIAEVLKVDRKSLSEDMISAFIKQFNDNTGNKE